jgi:hypothetical protein
MLSGTVNPRAKSTSGHFLFGPASAFASGMPTPTLTLGSGTAAVPANATLTGLAPGTTYEVELSASNSVGSSLSTPVTFTTLAATVTMPPRPPHEAISSVLAAMLTNSVFAVGSSPTALIARARARRHPRGTTFVTTLSGAGRLQIRIQRRVRGHRRGRACVAKRAKVKTCTTTKTLGTLIRTAVAGVNRTSFSGRLGRRALAPGSYTAVITVTNSAGTSAPRTVAFTVVAR